MVRMALDDVWRRTPPERIMVRFSVLGARNTKTVEAFPYALTDGLDLPAFNAPAAFQLSDEPAFQVDEASHTIRIKPGVHTLTHDVFIPAGYTVQGTAPLHLDLQQGARIVSRSPMVLKGLDDAPIMIGSSDASGAGLVLLSTGARSRFDHVRFEGFGPGQNGTPSIIFQETTIDLVDCFFQEVSSRRILTGVRSSIALERCAFSGGSDQFTIAYCNTRIAGGALIGAADDAVVMKGGQLALNDIRIDASGSAMVLDEFARVTVDAGSIDATKDALRMSEGASISMHGGSISSRKGSAFKVDDVHGRHGPSKVELKAVLLEGAEPVQEGKGNDVDVSPGSGTVDHSE